MVACVDIQTAEFVIEVKPGGPTLRLSWPQDKYYDLVRAPVQVVQMEASVLTRLASEVPGLPDEGRLAALSKWFTEASKGERKDWPPLPVLVKNSSGLEFVDGRHRSLVLSNFGALRVPVIIG